MKTILILILLAAASLRAARWRPIAAGFLLTLTLLAAASLQGQQLSTTSAPPSPPTTSGGIVGAPGFNTYYYMVIANYPGGSTQSNIFTIPNGNATLNSTNYNSVSWTNQPNALTYDVLRLNTNAFSGSCTCSVATGLTQTTFNDQGGSLSAYTVSPGAVGGTATFYVDTSRYAFPKLRVLVNNADHLAEIVSGPTLPSYCITGDIFVRTGATAPGVYICNGSNTYIIPAPLPSGTGFVTVNSGVPSAVTLSADSTCSTSTGACTVSALGSGDATYNASTHILQLPAAGVYRIGPNAGISQSGGVILFGNGTAGNAGAPIKTPSVNSTDGNATVQFNVFQGDDVLTQCGGGFCDYNGPTAPPSPGCSATVAGHNTVGAITSGTTGVCTVVLMFALTAPHGWYCAANNITTTANAFKQTATSTTSCTMSGTTVTGDILPFFAKMY